MHSEIVVLMYFGVSDVYFDAKYIRVKLYAGIWLENCSKNGQFSRQFNKWTRVKKRMHV